MRRILIVGNSGGGKSTLARSLGERLGLPVIHLDVLFWKPDWVESDRAEFRTRVGAALAGDAWVCDGNFSSTWDLRMPLADTIVWIDRPRLLCLWRAIRRALIYRGGGRPDMAEGCRETIDLKFYHFIWTFDARVRPPLEAALTEHGGGGGARVIRLRSEREIADFLAAWRPAPDRGRRIGPILPINPLARWPRFSSPRTPAAPTPVPSRVSGGTSRSAWPPTTTCGW